MLQLTLSVNPYWVILLNPYFPVHPNPLALLKRTDSHMGNY